MSDPWSNPPGGGQQPPPPPGGGGAPPPPPPPPGGSVPPPPPPPPSTPSWSAPPPPPPSTPSWSAPPPPPPNYGGTPGVTPGSGYGPTPAYMGAPAASGQKTNTLAIVALVSGIVGICCGIGSIAGIVCGILARNQIKASNGLEKGDGMALAGIIVGGITLVLNILAVILFNS